MSILAVAATGVGVFLGLANVPQAYKIFTSKSAKDIAPSSFFVITVGSFVWILYGIEIKSIPIIIPNTLGFMCTLVVLIGYFMYGRKKK